MKIVFASNAGFLPEFSGGVQSSTDYLVRECRKNGHEAVVFSALFGDGPFGFAARLKLKIGRSSIATDRGLGYPVLRAWNPVSAVDEVIRRIQPDVIVAQCHGTVELGAAFEKHGIPIVVYLRNVEFDELGGDPSTLRNCRFIANSEFTKQRYAAAFGIDSIVIPPLIDRDKYAVDTERKFVTFINPVEKKGVRKFLEIAQALPNIPFLVIEGWGLTNEQLHDLNASLEGMTNVTFQRRTDDMRRVYSQTKILLVPSLWEEAWGRVASEAHCSGIPVVGSRRGGLVEAIGPGGIVLDFDASTQDWSIAVDSLWTDDDLYRAKSEAARIYAGRPEMNEVHQFSVFQSVLEAARDGAR